MPISFEAEHTEGLSRIGQLDTPHGTVTTPALMPVINPNLELVDPAQMRERFGVEMVITNSYIIHRSEEHTATATSDGVHALVGFDGPVMTDSGTFQDYVYGDRGIDPREIVAFQRSIGSDIGTILDVFSTPDRTRDEAREDAEETLVRAMDTHEAAGEMGLALPVQGATFPDEREAAARDISRISPEGGAIHPIGGVVPIMEQQRYALLARVILGAKRGLNAGRAVHLFGAGHPQMLAMAVYLGCDLFDSAAYAKFAHDDRLLFPWGTEHLEALTELPCSCPVCRGATAEDLAALDEDERVQRLAEHNLFVTMREMRRIREAQRRGRLFELVAERATSHPALDAILDVLETNVDQLEREEPLSAKRALSVLDHAYTAHPQLARARDRLQRRVDPRGPVTLLDPVERPFTRNAEDTVEALRARGVHPFFPSRLGPVPYDLDEAYPFSQSLETDLTDTLLAEQRDRLAELATAWGVEVLDPDAAVKRKPSQTPDLLTERVEATLGYQFGLQAARHLVDGELDVETSPRSGRVKTVHVDGEHVVSRRAYDGLYTLKLAGAKRLHRWLPRPYRRLRVTEDSARFNADGKSVFAKFVLGCQKGLRPGDECLVVDPDDELVACGRLTVSQPEALDLGHGQAAKVREGIGREAYEA